MVAKTNCEINSDFQSLILLGLNTYLPPRKKKKQNPKASKRWKTFVVQCTEHVIIVAGNYVSNQCKVYHWLFCTQYYLFLFCCLEILYMKV